MLFIRSALLSPTQVSLSLILVSDFTVLSLALPTIHSPVADVSTKSFHNELLAMTAYCELAQALGSWTFSL